MVLTIVSARASEPRSTDCSHNINLTFELVVDTAGWKSVTVLDRATQPGSMTCGAISFSPQNDTFIGSPSQQFYPGGQEAKTFQIFVNDGWTLSLYWLECRAWVRHRQHKLESGLTGQQRGRLNPIPSSMVRPSLAI